MADLVFNIAKGRVTDKYIRVDTDDPTTSALLVIALAAGTTTDANFRDFDTVSACLPGGGGAAEATNTNYARKVLVETDLVAFAPDDTNDRVDLDFPDQTFAGIAAGTNWTDILIAYRNATADADSVATTIPLTLHDFPVTPDGSDIVVQTPNGFFRAS